MARAASAGASESLTLPILRWGNAMHNGRRARTWPDTVCDDSETAPPVCDFASTISVSACTQQYKDDDEGDEWNNADVKEDGCGVLKRVPAFFVIDAELK